MYRAYFGLSDDPFDKSLDVKHHFKSSDFNDAFSRLEYLKSTKGFGLITGEPGYGKSYLLRYFLGSLNPNLYKPIYIPISTLTVMDFYRALCISLGISPSHKKINMFTQLQEAIYTLNHSKNITPVIVVDEAQFLKNSVLDDLRIIFNFNMDSTNLATLILSGQTQLISQLSRQNHEALRQRIVMNYCMRGLSKDESKDYVMSRLKISGVSEPIFTDDAYELMYSSTNGCLRSLNSLAKMSLICASNEDARSINSELIFRAQSEINIIA